MKKKVRPGTGKAVPAGFELRLPVLRSPFESALEDAAGDSSGEIRISNEVEHAFFLRCCELYRVLDLLQRIETSLIETYSKYRTRDQFKEALSFRYFDSELSLVARFEPDLAAIQLSMFNLLHELRVSLTHADALPYTVKGEIDTALAILTKQWSELRLDLRSRYGWRFREIGALPA